MAGLQATKETSSADRVVHFSALACLFFSGFLSLVYEICWIRKSSLVFGSTSLAVATTLATFFAGIACGSYVLGRVAKRFELPMKVFGTLEIGIGVYAILTPLFFVFIDTCVAHVYPWVSFSSVLLGVTRGILLGLVLALPTFLMGGALPIFCRQFVWSENKIGIKVGILCGVNTIGAAVGCALTGFFFIRYVGINKTLISAGVSNVLMGFFAWSLPFRVLNVPQSQKNIPLDQRSTESFGLIKKQVVFILVFICGFVGLGLEVVWTRYLSLLIYNTIYTYTLTLTFILSGLFLGNLFASIVLQYSKRQALLFGNLQVLLGISVLTLLLLPASWWQSWVSGHNAGSHLTALAILFVPPSILSGISFPLAVSMVVNRATASPHGVGKMTALNTFGGILGSLLIGFVAIPVMGLYLSVLFITGLSVFCGVVAWIFLADEISKSLRTVMVVLITCVLLGIPTLARTKLPEDYLAGKGKLLDYREGNASFMAIVLNQGECQLEIDRLWQGEAGRNHQSMAAHIPMFHHKHPEDVLVIGIGTGQTAKRFLMHPAIKSLDCVDLEEELVELVRQYFDSQWLDDPRVHQIFDDGRNFLAHTQKKYDVISIEAGQTFRPQVAKLYSLEFYESARQRLKPDGIVAQFVPVSMLNSEQFLLILKTFLESFPQSALWYNSSELLLIGTLADHLALPSDYLARLTQSSVLQKDMEFSYWGGPEFWVSHPEVFAGGFLCGSDGLRKLTKGTVAYRDEIPSLEYMALAKADSFEQENAKLIEEVLESPILNIEKSPPVIDPMFIRKVQYLNLGDLHGMAAAQKARTFLLANELSAAIDSFRQAVKCNPKNVEYLNNLGMSLRLAGDLHGAESQFLAVIAEDPQSTLGYSNLGITLFEQGQLDGAIWCLQKAIELEPADSYARHHLANAFLKMGRYRDAILHFQKAVELNPGDVTNYTGLVRGLIAHGKYQQARSFYLKAKELAPALSPPPGFDNWDQ